MLYVYERGREERSWGSKVAVKLDLETLVPGRLSLNTACIENLID